MLPVAQLSWCHSVEGWTLRSTICVRNAGSSWDASCHRDFKVADLEEQEMRNNLFWWLYFLFVRYKQAQLMTLELPSLLFILISCLESSRRQLSCHYQSHYQGLGGCLISAHLPEVMTGHSYLWRRNQKWKQIVLKLISTLNTIRRKPHLLLLWNSQLHDYWGKICSFSGRKTTQNMPVQRSGRRESKISCRGGRVHLIEGAGSSKLLSLGWWVDVVLFRVPFDLAFRWEENHRVLHSDH